MARHARHPQPPPLDAPTNRPSSAPYDFVPQFCPRPGCPAQTDFAIFRATKYGSYRRKAFPYRIPRFRCLVCGRTFSTQTFSTTYYLKRPELLAPTAKQLNNGMADRHVRRTVRGNDLYAPHIDVGAAGSTISRLVPRLARHAILVHAEMSGGLSIDEPLAADDFETFCVTQLHAVAVPTVVGLRSSWVYALDVAPHRRGGKLTPAQLRAEESLRERGVLPDPRERARSWNRVLSALLEKLPDNATAVIASDASTAIVRAIAKHPLAGRIRHRAFPNPPRGPKGRPASPAARARDAALAEVDLLHRWFRHSKAHDRRETIAFSRSVNALLGRQLLFALNRNLVQPRRERRRSEGTPAMHLGLLPRPVSWEELLERRRFIAQTPKLPPGLARAYFEQIPTLGRKSSKRRFASFHRA